MKLSYIGIFLIVLGFLGLVIISLFFSQNYVKSSNTITLSPGESYNVTYNGNSEILFGYNFTNPIEVIGYPSSATTSNDSKYYVICFFSSSPGYITLKDNYSSPSIVYYTLYESSGSSLYSEYLVSLAPVIIIGGIVLIIYEKIAKKNRR